MATKKKDPKRMARSQNGVGSWLQNQLWNTSLVWLLGVLIIGTTFWINTTNKLDSHDKVFEDIKLQLKDQKSTLIESKKTEKEEREKVRKEFLDDSKSTASGMAELNKQTAVMGTVLSQVKDELVKLNTRMDSAPSIKLK